MRKLTPEEIAQVEIEAHQAEDNYLKGLPHEYGSDGGNVILNLIAHIRLVEHELECYRTKHDPPFEPSPPTLPKRMEKVIRRPSHSVQSI